ncbi:MAG: metal ABC transporter permease [Deltaproteobacteria bacterium]|nr:metal ABC transporter permease [Deltaproteobacteria bacterium]
MSILELMAAPFAECLVLVAIHTYLGIHVLKRRVIFVDLALAQIAALGTTVGFLFGIMPETPAALVFSMAFTFLGAAVFSITRFRHERVPQEAVIGLTYAIACATAILVVEKTRGAEHLKDILVGNLLWVKWSDVATAAIVYAVVGVVHFAFRKKFLTISENADAAFRSGMHVRAWDFLFYLTFGVVITLSTRVAGVLLVFVFLVAPAILAFILTSQMWLQLLIGWVMGTLVTIAGLYLSWHLDLPSGPAVIALYGVALVAGGIMVFLWRAPKRPKALRSVLLGLGTTAAVMLALSGLGRWLGGTSMALSDEARQVQRDISRDRAAADLAQAEQQDARTQTLTARVGRCVGRNKIARHLSFADPEAQLTHAGTKLAEDTRRGLEFLLVALADDELPLLYREEGVALLAEYAKQTFGYDPQREAADNEEAIARICDYVRGLKFSAPPGAAKDPGQ